MTTSIGIFIFASAVAGWAIALANSHSEANAMLTAAISFSIYFLGFLTAIRYLRRVRFRSVLGWVALSLNAFPFGIAAMVIVAGMFGY